PDELPDALASADALLHGSAAETYGLVVAEALVSGLPLVVPDRGGAADLAAPAYAETYPAGHPEAASRAIHRLLDRDPTELRAAALSGAQARVRSVDAHFDALFARYARLTPRSTTATPRVTHP
ncbi:MAG: glycosyl transferase family 1, partial [Sandaracinus sp.]|nr:glycosyl transferase family 1 [Sandaracinus sp.]